MEKHQVLTTYKQSLRKADIDHATTKVKEILDVVWREKKTPEKWRKGLIIKLPKKGNLRECKNWRGISLLSVVIKVMGKIVVDRIRTGVESKLRKEQTGSRQRYHRANFHIKKYNRAVNRVAVNIIRKFHRLSWIAIRSRSF